MIKLLGKDYETQHADGSTAAIIEVGAKLLQWSGEKWPSGAPGPHWGALCEKSLSSLVYHPLYPAQTKENIDITGITDDMLKAGGKEPRLVMQEMIGLVEEAEMVMAWNKKFDKLVFTSVCKRMELSYPDRLWVDPMSELPWPKRITCHKMGHVALEMGLKMDDRELHRAINDVELMLELVMKNFSLQDIQDYLAQPWVYLQAKIMGPWIGSGGDGGVGKTKATALGYTWEKAKGTDEPIFVKRWVKRVKANQVQSELNHGQFEVVELPSGQV